MASRSRVLPLLFLFAMSLGLATPSWSQEDADPAAALTEAADQLEVSVDATEAELSAFEKFDAFWGANVNTPISNAFFWDVWF